MRKKNAYLLVRVLPIVFFCLVFQCGIPAWGQTSNEGKGLVGWILPKGKDIAWQMKYQLRERESQAPANDVNGNDWKVLAYDDSSWEILTGPMWRSQEAASYIITPQFTWEGDRKAFYLRRTFYLSSIPSEEVTLHLLQDDTAEIYINGTNVCNVGSWTKEWNTYSIAPNVFVKGTNIIAIKYTTEGIPDYIDYGLEGVIPSEDGGTLPKLYLETSKTDLTEGETFQLTVTADHTPDAPTSLMLTCDNSARFDFPSKLTLPAGQTTVSTSVTVIDDHDIAETQTAAFTVSAVDYESGEAIVLVSDDDMPHIELSVAPTAVQANAGTHAVMGTIRRSDNLNSKLTIVLSDDADGLLSYSPQQVTLERGAAEAQFTISTEGTVSTDREVNITAAVYVKACDCPAEAQSGGSTTQSLMLLAGEGAALTIAPLATDFCSDSDSNGLVITIDSPAQQNLTVSLASDFDAMLNYSNSVVIPAGETTVTVPVGKRSGADIPEGQVITFTATATGYATAACWMIATENSLPDAVITSLEVSATEAEAGSEVELTLVVKNIGSGLLSEGTPVKVALSDKSYPVMLKTGASLSSGESTTMTTNYELPLLTGIYSFQAIVNPSGRVEEAVTINNMSQEIPITIKPNYQVTATTDKTEYAQGEVITVTGKATGTKSAFADVEVYFVNDGMRQTVKAKTDSEGNYMALFLPIDGTAGHFSVGACFPGEEKTEAMVEVYVYGLKLESYRTTCKVVQNGTYSGSIAVSNPCDRPQTNIRVVQQDSPTGCEFSFTDNIDIAAGETVDIPFTINAGSEVTAGMNRMYLSVRSDQDALVEHTVDYSIEPAKGCLKTDSTSISMTMTLGQAREFPLTVWNEGMGPTGAISLTLPTWIQSVTPQQLPSLAPGDSLTVILRLMPTDDMYLKGRIGMICAEGTGLSVGIEVTSVSDQTGTITIDVVDEFTWCTEEKPHVSGAKVQVLNRANGAIVAEGFTNDEGKFTFDVLGGWYRLKVSADYHETYDGMLLVDPGLSRAKRIFISFNGITTEWNVEETEVEDEYSMETVLKFETQVPPPYIEVVWPKEKPQLGKYFPVTLINQGLIKFFDVKTNLRVKSGKYGIEIMGSSEIDTLAAGQAVVFYARLTSTVSPDLAKAVSKASEESGSNTCLELTSDTEAKCECYVILDKEFEYTKNYGNCNPRRPYTSGSGTGGGYDDDGDDDNDNDNNNNGKPENIACDIPKFKIVTVNGNKKVLGVATDSVSQVKIVLDGDYDKEHNNKINWGSWTVDGNTNYGGIEYIDKVYHDPLEGVIYTAPTYFPGDDETVYKVRINLPYTLPDKQEPDVITVEVELIRVPVLMVHGLNSNGDDCWRTERNKIQGLYEYLAGIPINPNASIFVPYINPKYAEFQLYVLDYRGTHNDHFIINVEKIGDGYDHLINAAKKHHYVVNKIDVVAHSMGGVLTKMYIQSGNHNKFNKVITINTPHGGSQLGNLMNDPKVQFIKDIKSKTDRVPIEIYPYSKEVELAAHPDCRKALRKLYECFLPSGIGLPSDKEPKICDGAVYDLSVGGTAIENINKGNTAGVKCHAITTYSILGSTWQSTLAEWLVDFLEISAVFGYDNIESFLLDLYNGMPNDFIVPGGSQYGGLINHVTTKPGGLEYCHVRSCHNPVIQSRVFELLSSSNSDLFANGFEETGNLEYMMEGLTWSNLSKIYKKDDIANWDDGDNLKNIYGEEIAKELGEDWETFFSRNSPSMVRAEAKDAGQSYLNLTYDYIEGDTLMNVKVNTPDDFVNVSFSCLYNERLLATFNSNQGIVHLPEKIQSDIVVMYQGKRADGSWCGMSDTIAVNTVGNTVMQELSFLENDILIINDEHFYPKVMSTWSDGVVTEVDNPTLSVTNGNLAYIEDNKYVYGKNTGHTNLVATYGNLSCSTPLEVYITQEEGDDAEDDDSSSSGRVCSSVTIGFNNKSVMTRQAFRGTLTINNNHPSLALQNLKLHLEVRDENGTLATQREFQISPEALNGDFEGELDFDTGWSLKSGGKGVATILFIPTKNAAPTEPKRWSFGGTISYTDPFTGLVVTHSLNPVTLTVNPTPVLDFTYFMQRDAIGDDPMTPNINEESVPAEFALLINNKGNADAKNLRFICRRPEIVENEQGLQANFTMVSSQLNGVDKALALSDNNPIEVGTVSAQSQSYMQWWMKSSTLGHFTEYDVSYDHMTSFGNEELSLIDQVTIHELIQGFTPSQLSTPARGFLVNDIEDDKDMPDRIYFTDATQAEVTIAAAATATQQGTMVCALSVVPYKQGWTYAVIDSPVGNKMQVVTITRQSDGKEIPADNVWLTYVTLRDDNIPIIENKLHFIGEVPEGGEQYLVTFEYKPSNELVVESYEGVPDEDVELEEALTEITVHFNKPISEETFTVDDLSLFLEGTAVDMSTVSISRIDDQTFRLILGTATSQGGYYVLMVNTQTITDSEGFEGTISKEASWMQKKEEETPVGVTDISQLTDAIYITPFNAPKGGEVEMEICLKNAQAATAYLFTIVLPEGVTVMTNSDGHYMDVLTDRHGDHSRKINYRGDNTYTLSAFSLNSEELTGNDGSIRLLKLRVDDDVTPGMYAVDIQKASYSTLDGTLVKMQNTTSSITVEDYVQGDVNGNGDIDIGDAVSVVNHLVGKVSNSFVEKAADANKNGVVDIGDAVTIINYLVGKITGLNSRQSTMQNHSETK